MSGEPKLIPGVPSTIQEMISMFNISDLKRTTRQKGSYYFRSTVDGRYSIKYDLQNRIFSLRFDAKNGTWRQESVSLNSPEHRLYKSYTENGHRGSTFRRNIYPLFNSEEEHFQYSVVCDESFIPDYNDIQELRKLRELIFKETRNWNDVLYERKKERKKASYIKYQEFLESVHQYHRKSKKKKKKIDSTEP